MPPDEEVPDCRESGHQPEDMDLHDVAPPAINLDMAQWTTAETIRTETQNHGLLRYSIIVQPYP